MIAIAVIVAFLAFNKERDPTCPANMEPCMTWGNPNACCPRPPPLNPHHPLGAPGENWSKIWNDPFVTPAPGQWTEAPWTSVPAMS